MYSNEVQYFYPRVVQIMPCQNMWFRYAYKDEGIFYYSRVPCLALVETLDRKARTIYTDIRYIDADSLGLFDEDPNHESIFYCELNLEDFTHSLDDERHPLAIIKGLSETITETA
jgi:hypothetical protein